jgi:hypothetical protein
LNSERGVLNQTEKVPDTITEWIIDSYCLSAEKGLGVAQRKNLKVFQPLFVSLDLPYSVISKEVFEVKASIFNYESSCFPVNNLKFCCLLNYLLIVLIKKDEIDLKTRQTSCFGQKFKKILRSVHLPE